MTDIFYIDQRKAHNSEIFTDLGKLAISTTAYGGTKFSNAQSKFGDTSMFFDGVNDNLELDPFSGIALSTYIHVLALGTPDFTVEAFVYIDGSTYTYKLYNIGRPGSGTGSVQDNRGGLVIQVSNTEVSIIAGNLSTDGWIGYLHRRAGNLALSAGWHHIAVQSVDNTPQVFVDGVMKALSFGNPSSSQTSFAELKMFSPRAIQINSQSANNGDIDTTLSGDGAPTFHTGYIAEYRITKGAARYPGNFTPPNKTHLRVINGIITGADGSPAARSVLGINRNLGEIVNKTISDASTGAYELAFFSDDEIARVVISDDDTPLLNDIVDRIIPG